MKQAVLDTKGAKLEELELTEKFFDVARNDDLVQQVTVIQQGNQRRVISKVKDRGEVRGGGKKPWRQKGTGRARHGSSRSPIWKGGGVTHGPTANRNYKRKMNIKMQRKALFCVLSEKFRNKQVIILDSLDIKNAKTKELIEALKTLPLKEKSTLLVLPSMDAKIIRAAQNIPHIKTIQARELNALQLVQITYVVLLKESVLVIEETFGK